MTGEGARARVVAGDRSSATTSVAPIVAERASPRRERTLRALADERSGERVGRDVAHHLEPGGDRVVVLVARAHPPPVHDASRDLSRAPGAFSRTSSATRARSRTPIADRRERPRPIPARSTGSTGRTSRRPAAPVAVPRRRPRPDPIVSVCRRLFRPLGVENEQNCTTPSLEGRRRHDQEKCRRLGGAFGAERRRGSRTAKKKKRACRFSRHLRVVGNFGASDGSFLGVAGGVLGGSSRSIPAHVLHRERARSAPEPARGVPALLGSRRFHDGGRRATERVRLRVHVPSRARSWCSSSCP